MEGKQGSLVIASSSEGWNSSDNQCFSMWNMLVLPMSVWVKIHAGLIERLTGHFLFIIVDDGSSSQTTGINKSLYQLKKCSLLYFIHYFFPLKALRYAFPATPLRCLQQPPFLEKNNNTWHQ